MDNPAMTALESENHVHFRSPLSASSLLREGGVEVRRNARHRLKRRFIHSDFWTEAGVCERLDLHPEGPSSLPERAPDDIRLELVNARTREEVKRAAISQHIPRLREVVATRDSLLQAEGHTKTGSHALRVYEGGDFPTYLREGEALVTMLEAQRRDLWFEPAKCERKDLVRETRMLKQAKRIFCDHDDVATLDEIGLGSAAGVDATLVDIRFLSNSNLAASTYGSASEEAVSEAGISMLGTPDNIEPPAQTSKKAVEMLERQANVQRLAEGQEVLSGAKKTEAMDLMLPADQANQEASKEAQRLQGIQNTTVHSEGTIFDARAEQLRMIWMAKSNLALQTIKGDGAALKTSHVKKRLRYQEAVEELQGVQAEWGSALDLKVCLDKSPRAASSAQGFFGNSNTYHMGEEYHRARPSGTSKKPICLWVIGGTSKNISGKTLSRAYFGAFSESTTVPSTGWMAFDEGSSDIPVHSVFPKPRNGVSAGSDECVIDGTQFSEMNGRHLLRGSEELDIARETCLPESELDADKTESRAAKAGPSLSRGVSENVAMDFSRLVKSSLQAVNLDHEDRVRLSHHRLARAITKIDSNFQEHMNKASASLKSIETTEGCAEDGPALRGGLEKNRHLAILEASDSAKLTFQDDGNTEDKGRVVLCKEHGAPPLCKRWIARACPRKQIHCRCRHYFISHSERDRITSWREGRDAKAELDVLACIAKRETLLAKVKDDALACDKKFLSEMTTAVKERDVTALLKILDQLRLESVRVVEAIFLWRKDKKVVERESRHKPCRPKPTNWCDLVRLKSTKPSYFKHRHGVPRDNEQDVEDKLASSKSQAIGTSGSAGVSNGFTGNAAESTVAAARGRGVEDLDEVRKGGGNPKSTQSSTKRQPLGRARVSWISTARENRAGNHHVARITWVVTMMVQGRKLWESSPAVRSKYKRFCRTRQDTKIARNQLYLGVFKTKTEALQTFDHALHREAVKQRSSVSRMPKRRIVSRPCGKHMAVQSEDTPPGRPCEQCAVEALGRGINYSLPYVWNNFNYLQKMTKDLDFLADVDSLVGWLGHGFPLEGNPFLLTSSGKNSWQEGLGNHPPDKSFLCPLTGATPVGRSSDHSTVHMDSGVHHHALSSRSGSSRCCDLTLSHFHDSSIAAGDAIAVAQTDSAGTGALNSDTGSGVNRVADCLSRESVRPRSEERRADRRISKALAWATWSDTQRASNFKPTASSPRKAFGRPTAEEVTELTRGRLKRGDSDPDFEPRRERATIVEVLDFKRLEKARAVLNEEENIADSMAGNPPRKHSRLRPLTTTNAAMNVIFGEKRPIASAVAGVGPCSATGHVHSTYTSSDQASDLKIGLEKMDEVVVTSKGKKRRGQETRNVLAVYKHRGAQLILAQTRALHPFRREGVFCRADRGEWAGQVHMSFAAKRFVARRLLDKALERRNKNRGRIGRMMHTVIEQPSPRHVEYLRRVKALSDLAVRRRSTRRAFNPMYRGQPIYRLESPRLRSLLLKARSLGGDRFTFDIMEAETALRLYQRAEKSATKIQAVRRSILGRVAAKQLNDDEQERGKAEGGSRYSGHQSVAEGLVKDVLHEAMRGASVLAFEARLHS